MRQQADRTFPQYARFAVFPATNSPVSYPITYVAPASPTTNYGFDLGSDPIRRQALEVARDTGDVKATGSIDLNISRTSQNVPERPGFFITIPIYANKSTSNFYVPQTLEERRQVWFRECGV